MRQRSCQTDLHVARVPRGTRAMPVNEKPCVSRRDSFFYYFPVCAESNKIMLYNGNINFYLVIL